MVCQCVEIECPGILEMHASKSREIREIRELHGVVKVVKEKSSKQSEGGEGLRVPQLSVKSLRIDQMVRHENGPLIVLTVHTYSY